MITEQPLLNFGGREETNSEILLIKMSKYPCGECDTGVKYSGIRCTGTCNKWFHARCVNISETKLKKFSKQQIEAWSCHNCFNILNKSTEIMVLENKIDSLINDEVMDHETSLSLAAEVGQALLLENTQLKQELHNLRLKKSQREAELEDQLHAVQESGRELCNKITSMVREIQFLLKKLQEEIKLKEELMKDAKTVKSLLTIKVKDLLDLQSHYKLELKNSLEDGKKKTAYCNNIQQKLDDLSGDIVKNKEELLAKDETITALAEKCGELESGILDRDNAIESYCTRFFHKTRSYLKPHPPHLTSHTDQTVQGHKTKTNSVGLNTPLTFPPPQSLARSSQLKHPNKNQFSISLQKIKHQQTLHLGMTPLTLTNLMDNATEQLNVCNIKKPAVTSDEVVIPLKEPMASPLKVYKGPPITAKKLVDKESFEDFLNRNIEEALKNSSKSTYSFSCDNKCSVTEGSKDNFLEFGELTKAKMKEMN
ncbi:hypothetical protein J6590_101676 [Homalodisca vitripennis]|nr:hypothetical protein J6590_101676 [Homalodisca vitripennis]